MLVCSRWCMFQYSVTGVKCSTKAKCCDPLTDVRQRRKSTFVTDDGIINLIKSVLSLSVCQLQLRREILQSERTHSHSHTGTHTTHTRELFHTLSIEFCRSITKIRWLFLLFQLTEPYDEVNNRTFYLFLIVFVCCLSRAPMLRAHGPKWSK